MKINETLFISHSELSERKVLYKYRVLLLLFNDIFTEISLYIFQNLGRVVKSGCMDYFTQHVLVSTSGKLSTEFASVLFPICITFL